MFINFDNFIQTKQSSGAAASGTTVDPLTKPVTPPLRAGRLAII